MYLKKINLKNKVALVTGAGKGIGKACAIALAEAGADLIIISRTQKDLDQVSKIIKRFKSKCSSYVCDVTNYNQIKNIINKQKKIDILVNNAGTNIPEHFTKVQKKNMEYLVKVNTIATFNLAQLCTLKMLKTKNRKKIGGSIINMSSQMGHIGAPNRTLYCTTKHAVEGLTKSLAVELAPQGIRVNAVAPTFIDTPFTRPMFEDKAFKKTVENNIALGHIGTVEDVAAAVIFLASPAAAMITGESLKVDGGWTAK